MPLKLKDSSSNKEIMVGIVGPTATGKSRIAINLAKHIDGEIISADSMLTYKYLQIGVAKPSEQDLKEVTHYLIDVRMPWESFSVAQYQQLASEALTRILNKGKTPIICGGTGLYIRAFTEDFKFPELNQDIRYKKLLELRAETDGVDSLYYELIKKDPESAKFININNKRRIIRALEAIKATGKPFSSFRKEWDERKSKFNLKLFGLELPRDILYDRINKRVDDMVKNGLVEEVKLLTDRGMMRGTAYQAIGYRQIADYIKGNIDLKNAIDEIKQKTRNYAKRQFTWFKSDPRIKWIDVSEKTDNQVVSFILSDIKKD